MSTSIVHLTVTFVAALLLAPLAPLGVGAPTSSNPVPSDKKLPLPGEVFLVAGRTAFIIPAKFYPAGPSKPWVWYAPTLPGLPGQEEQWMFEQFVNAGIAVAGIDVGESYGSPAGNNLFTAFHATMTAARGFASKPVLLGRSRGGLMTLSWAASHPDKVAAFAGIYPVCNLASYPGVAPAAGAYGMKPEELQAHLTEYNPIDRLAALAKARVPLFAIHGDADKVVPLEVNSGLMKERYTALGGAMQLVVRPGQGHNMWSGFFQSQELVDFVIAHANSELAGSLSQAHSVSSAPSATIEKAFISFRIGTSQWMPDQRYRDLLDLFERHKGVTDEITFFTSFTHPNIPLEEMRRRCELLARRITQAKALGYRSGINVLSTMGHHEENLPNALAGDYTPVTDIAGGVCRGSLCPNDPRLQEYVRQLYQYVAAANPDYIWIDDDVRLMGHMPVGLTCFCDHCLAIFGKESGTNYTRTSLRAALTTGKPEECAERRKAWLAHNRATIGRLLSLIEQTVHAAKPGLPLGFMTGDRFFEGYDFDRWAEVLAGPNGAPVYWRPGGGFYEDSTPGGLVGKSHDIGRQVAFLPASVLSIQSEIENFPYQRLKKAAHITAVEAAVHLGAGCTGAAFNVLSGNDEPLDEFEPLVARLHQTRPFYDLLARHLGRARPIGLFTAWNKDQAAAGDFINQPGWSVGHLGQGAPVLEMGLPAAYHPQAAAVTLLFPQSVAAMSREEIRNVLAGGVYTDVETLNILNQLGFQELTGMAAEQPHPVDCIEEFTAHPLNGPFVQRQRDCRQSFYRVSGYIGYVLKKHDPKVETLARLIDYGGKELSPCSLAVYENKLGGRICVSGYYPWDHLHSLSKTSQMKAVMRWLSRERLPAYVASYHKVNLWTREPQDGRVALVLLNASFDGANGLDLAIATTAEEAHVFDMQAQEQVVRAVSTDGPYRRFVLPALEPWTLRLVIVRNRDPLRHQ